MTKLSVNLNKVALLRNQRDGEMPDLLSHAKLILEAGAHGLTVHPRPDERHIRKSDIPAISNFLKEWDNQEIEFNIEGYPSEEFIQLCLNNKCHQVTLVPDEPAQKTSDHGWDIECNKTMLSDAIRRLQDNGRRVSIFLDPDATLINHVKDVGADRIELYTGPYYTGDITLTEYQSTAQRAKEMNIDVNAGHDLTLDNLAHFITAIPECDEVSIGHAITADALTMGWSGAVHAYLTAIEFGQKHAKEKKI